MRRPPGHRTPPQLSPSGPPRSRGRLAPVSGSLSLFATGGRAAGRRDGRAALRPGALVGGRVMSCHDLSEMGALLLTESPYLAEKTWSVATVLFPAGANFPPEHRALFGGSPPGRPPGPCRAALPACRAAPNPYPHKSGTGTARPKIVDQKVRISGPFDPLSAPPPDSAPGMPGSAASGPHSSLGHTGLWHEC